MHPYATDSAERLKIPIGLAAVAVASAWQLPQLLKYFHVEHALWWADLPAVWGFYVLYWNLFDKWIWRWWILRSVGLVEVPDFSGTWTGHGVSSYTEHGQQKRYEVQLNIRQRWTRCIVRTQTESSQSESTIGAILVREGARPALSYEYRNQPRANATDGMHAHPGVTRLEMIDDEHLDGDYYSGRDRQTYGSLHLERQ